MAQIGNTPIVPRVGVRIPGLVIPLGNNVVAPYKGPTTLSTTVTVDPSKGQSQSSYSSIAVYQPNHNIVGVDYKGTQVVHLKRSGGVEVVSCDVYIGRQQYQGGWTLPRSPFYNPYSVKQYGLVEALRLYRQYLMSQPQLLAQLNTLVGKRLGCWCTNCSILPHPSQYVCHGQILMELIGEKVVRGEL